MSLVTRIHVFFSSIIMGRKQDIFFSELDIIFCMLFSMDSVQFCFGSFPLESSFLLVRSAFPYIFFVVSGASVGSSERSAKLGVHETLKKASQLNQR